MRSSRLSRPTDSRYCSHRRRRRREARPGFGAVVALLPEAASPAERDHLVLVHLAAIESHMYRHGHCPTGHLIRIMAGNYGGASEEGKQSIVRDGFVCAVSGVSSAEELEAITPLKRVTDTQYTDMYEQLISAWGTPPQKKVAEMMRTRLRTIHLLLPRHKCGSRSLALAPSGRGRRSAALPVRHNANQPPSSSAAACPGEADLSAPGVSRQRRPSLRPQSDRQNQYDVVVEALRGFDEMTTPGIEPMSFEWQQGWDRVNARERGKLDHRSPRTTTPQYQTEEDRLMAEAEKPQMDGI